MDAGQRAALARMPLAEGVGWLWRYVLDDDALQQVWDEHRGRCWNGILTFPLLVELVRDALLECRSGRESFLKHQEAGTLETSLQAAYGKLKRTPVAVSEALLRHCTQRLRDVFPEWACWQKPRSLQAFRVLIYDGKAIKRVAKRLKPCRGAPGGLLGGRALVAIDWETGLALAMRGDVDGDANDVKHLAALAPQVCQQFDTPRLHVCDSGFCDLEQPQHFTRLPGDHFVVRYHPKVKFYPEASPREQRSVDDLGQTIVESWGWLGSATDHRRRLVRRLELLRDGAKSVILITDLLDAEAYPATELLWIYRERWEIERVFQKVTEVFGLSHLIGCSPEASLFQFALCLMLYNLIQVVRGYVAQAQDREPMEISTEMLFRDVTRELVAWNILLPVDETVQHFERLPSRTELRTHLQTLFAVRWCKSWLASPPQALHRQTPRRPSRTHNSVYRLVHGKPKPKPRKNLARC
ncbi:MAG: transposase [Planctomycetaceae bacterium]|nr:transposase [Planctomycetaceae bacterium]